MGRSPGNTPEGGHIKTRVQFIKTVLGGEGN